MTFYDALETRDPQVREAALFAALPEQISHAKARAQGWAQRLADVDPTAVTTREALASVPVTRKSELVALQLATRPMGGLNATPVPKLARVFQSPGPLYEPQGRHPDPWRMARALFAAGVRVGDLVHNTFSYHFTPAGAMMETAATALGCPVFPAGTGQTELQAQAIADLQPAAYTGTPSFLKIILEKADELGLDAASLTKALVTGEALPGSLRAWFDARGVRVSQCYGTADFGLIAYETGAREGLVVDEGVILEIVRPGTGDPVPDGEVGEVVVTNFNPDYPLIRFGTGDMSAILAGQSPCGRTNRRIKGWMGRADQTTKVKGMFVTPGQVAEVVRRHAAVGRARLVVDQVNHQDVMTLRCEVAGPSEGLESALVESLRKVCKLRGTVEFLAPGSLPNDGKVIDDRRTYD